MEVSQMKTKDILAEVNRLTGKNIKRFSSRAAAERALAKAMGHTVGPTGPKRNVKRAKTARETWKSRSVRAARAARHAVRVAGVEYKSTAEAFRQLNLPMGNHVAFRGKLVASGAETFVAKNGDKYNFKLVQKEEKAA